MNKNGRTKSRWGLRIAALALATLVLACVIYIGDYYRADTYALETLRDPAEAVTLMETKDDRIAFIPDDPVAGLIFYPGGKVQYEAYAPLMEACAERGILCVLLHMPGNLAVLNADAARGIAEDYPQVTQWYIGGHSLGGVMAASYAADHVEDFQGLILLASYSTADLSGSGLRVLSVFGSEDGVLDREKYDAARENLPAGTLEKELDGGCHAGFGSYGPQKGDGTPSTSNEEQIRQTADAIAAIVSK